MQHLLIPVYLNQRIVFDLLAMIQDGISTVTRVSAVESERDSEERRYGAAFGLNSALAALLKVDLSAESRDGREGSREEQRSEERIHTPASLFFKLREILHEEQRITSFGTGKQLEPGHVVEFTTSLHRNSLIQAMDALVGTLEVAIMFSEEPQQRKGKRQAQQPDDGRRIKSQMERFTTTLKAGDTIDLVSSELPDGFRAVVTLEQEYLNDPTMADLVDGQFSVLGKVIRVIPDGEGSISLIRKTNLSAMPTGVLTEAFSHFEMAVATGGFNLPEIRWEVEGPVVHILPIAIFA